MNSLPWSTSSTTGIEIKRPVIKPQYSRSDIRFGAIAVYEPVEFSGERIDVCFPYMG
jgi:hypothetical protein